jgi:5-formyltetrahydrofolate cyclo-ligase
MSPQNPQLLRRTIREMRRSLSVESHREYSRAICHQIINSSQFRRASTIALYLPHDGEIDLQPLISEAWSRNKRCYLPVLSPFSENRLWFAPLEPGERMVFNRFGISEPDRNWYQMAKLWSIDLLLMPLVAFDNSGNRLGMGGGFYDRSFAYLRQRSRWRKPHLLGTGFELQRVEQLPQQPWDVPLDSVVTEAGLWHL